MMASGGTSGYSFLGSGIRQILEGYRSGSLRPSDVAQMCIDQTERLDASYKVWTVFDAERLLREARAADERLRSGELVRALEGVPVGVKDIFNTADFPTQMGSPIWKGFTPGNDARAVFNIKRAGALVPGKTVTAEFAVHALGETLNPHDTTRTPGTSSSGSAVAVALGMVPAAIGTQTAGSIVRPASFCGVYGCKPSFGLIPRTGVLKTTDSLDSIGFFVTNAEDLVRVFDALRVHGRDYPLSDATLNDERRQMPSSEGRWRVGIVRTHVWEGARAYAREALLEWADRLAGCEGAEVTEVEMPAITASAHEIHSTIYDRTLAHYFQEEFQQHELVSPVMYEIISRGGKVGVESYLEALGAQEDLCRAVDGLFDDYDVLVSLSTAGAAPLREDVEKPDPALMWTMTHLPVISAPAFVSPDGLPFGVQLVARRYNDYLLFRFADRLRALGLIPGGPNPILPEAGSASIVDGQTA